MLSHDFITKYYLESALARGIRQVAIGKHGSKSLSPDLVEECLKECKSAEINLLQKGAFFGALKLKGLSPAEEPLETFLGKHSFKNSTFFLSKLCPDLPPILFPIGVKLLNGHTLQVSEAQQLGDFLLDAENDGCEVFKGMAVAILRMRYETNDEYEGFYKATQQTFSPGFKIFVKTKRPIIQLAEPFDGVEHSYMITPLLAYFFQERMYNSVTAVGRTAGPKYGLNSHDLYLYLGSWMLADNHELLEKNPTFGWVLDQKALSPALDRWVEHRRTIVKRPFWATLEKTLNPCGARILVTSVFHITYQTKMAELAMQAGFDAVMVLKRGLEGSLAPATSKANGLLCGVRNASGHLFYTRFESDIPSFVEFKTEIDEEVINPNAEQNATLIKQYLENRKTSNTDFDNRVNYAKSLYLKGLDWIESQIGY